MTHPNGHGQEPGTGKFGPVIRLAQKQGGPRA
jgi:hypothetical protein